jgi:DNA-directed RNA polymerase subunit M/transcription elongation factor TFIIS
MICPKCKGENVLVTTEQTGGKVKQNNMGCLWALGRGLLILCTGGLWLLVGKRKGKEKITYKNNTVAICQNCGNKWKV